VALLKYGYQEPVRVCVSCHETCTQSEELMTAISANGYVAVESLLDAGIKFLAVCWNAAVLGKVVLERALTGTPLNCAGADPNFSTIVFTPFMHAASKGHTKVMQLLRERGADIKYTVPRLDSNLSIECAPSPGA
jgi:ankyrin repeat protein